MQKENNSKLLVFALFLLLLSIPAQVWLPWWSIMALSALGALLFTSKALSAFTIAFFIITAEWLIYSWWINQNNDFIMANRIAQLFQLNGGLILLLVSALIAGIAAGFAATSGALLRGVFSK